MQSFNQEVTFVFDIGDHPTGVTCLLIAAETFKWMSSFKWKSSSIFQMDGREVKLSQFIFMELFFDHAVDLMMSDEITKHARIWFQGKKFCQTKHLMIACWQNHKNITACEMQLQHFDLLHFQSFLFSESEINIPATCHTYLEHLSTLLT